MEKIAYKLVVVFFFFTMSVITNYAQNSFTHDTGTMQLTVIDNGFIGDDGYKRYNGLTFNGYSNALFTGGIILGTSEDGATGMLESFNIWDMENTIDLVDFTSNPDFNTATNSGFTNKKASSPFGLDVYQQTFSNTGNDYVFYRYIVANNTGEDKNGLYIGIFADWDIGSFDSNLGGYDQSRGMAYQYENGGANDPNYYAIVALSGMAGARVTGGGGYSTIRNQAFEWMSTFLNEEITTNDDYRTFIGTGPFNIHNGDRKSVGFAIVAGSDLADLQTNVDRAISGWNAGIVTMPFIAHIAPKYYEGTTDEFEVYADIFDDSGISSAFVHYTVDDGNETTIVPVNSSGDSYIVSIPAQEPGAKVDYWIETVSNTGINIESALNSYISGNYLGYPFDSGFYTLAYYGASNRQGVAIRISIPDGFSSNLVTALLSVSAPWQPKVKIDSVNFHVWADNDSLPGEELIPPFRTPLVVLPFENGPVTIVDLRPYSSQLSGLTGDFHVGFTLNEKDTLYTTGFFPNSVYSRTSIFDGSEWSLVDRDHYFNAIVGELLVDGIENDNFYILENFDLYQNYPNPFNPVTNISFTLPKASKARLTVYNVLGQKVATLLNTHKPAGYYEVIFDAGQHASGVYYYKIETGEFTCVKKMLLVK